MQSLVIRVKISFYMRMRFDLKVSIDILLILFVVLCSCNNNKETSNTTQLPDTLALSYPLEYTIDSNSIPSTIPHSKSIGNYRMVFGYVHYDENKYGFSNPGYLKIFLGEEQIYLDSFKGEGPLEVKSLGIQDLNGMKQIFEFDHGTRACDYWNYARYFAIDQKKVYYLGEFSGASSGDQYSSIFYEPILPTDSLGIPNTIQVVQGQIFHEQDRPNLFDTTYFEFGMNGFTRRKPTNNLNSGKE